MSLETWHKSGWLRPHKTNRKQIGDLLNIVERDLADSRSADLSTDWRFGIAYNAALKLCTILLYAEGYRPERSNAHYRTLQALPHILGPDRTTDSDYLDACRIKRNTVEYDVAGQTSPDEAEELIQFTSDLRESVQQWLLDRHPKLTPQTG